MNAAGFTGRRGRHTCVNGGRRWMHGWRAIAAVLVALVGVSHAQTNPCDLLMGGTYDAATGTCYLRYGNNKSVTLDVPEGIDTLDVYLQGGSGGGTFANMNHVLGGQGGRVRGRVGVTPGQQLHIVTGYIDWSSGGSGGGFAGCGGGGGGGRASGMFDGNRAHSNQALLVAGGGGGAAASNGCRHYFGTTGGHSFNNRTNISWSYLGSRGGSGQRGSDQYGADATNGGGTGGGGSPGGAGGSGGTSSSKSTIGRGGGSAYRDGRVADYAFSTRAQFKDVEDNAPMASIRYNAGVSATHVRRDPKTPSQHSNASHYTFEVTFSDEVQGVTTATFEATGDVTANIESVTGNGRAYTVTLARSAGEGTLGLRVTQDAQVTSTSTDLGLISTFDAGETYTVDVTPPTVIANDITLTPNLGTLAVGDTITVAWDPHNAGEAQPLKDVAFDLSAFGGPSQYAAGVKSGDWVAEYTIQAQAGIKTDTLPFALMATDQAGNQTQHAGEANLAIDAEPPKVDRAYLTNATPGRGTQGALLAGDTLTLEWHAGPNGNGNDDLDTVTVDLSDFGGASDAPMTKNGPVWTVRLDVQDDTVDLGDARYTLTATDTAGNATTHESDPTVLDTKPPVVTPANVNIAGASGSDDAGGAVFKVDDDLVIVWDGSGDGNTDIVNVNVDFSSFGGPRNVSASLSGGEWKATYALPPGTLDADDLSVTLRAQDDGGNVTRFETPTLSAYTIAPPQPASPTLDADSKTGPTEFATNNPNPTVAGKAEPGSTVQLFIKGQSKPIEPEIETDGTWSHTLSGLSDGTYELTTRTVSAGVGNASRASKPFVLTVDTQAPTADAIAAAEPASGLHDPEDAGHHLTNEPAQTLTGTAEPGGIITIDANGTKVDAPVNADGRWVAKLPEGALQEGSNPIKLRLTDAAGNGLTDAAGKSVWVPSIPIELDTIAPLLNIEPRVGGQSITAALANASEVRIGGPIQGVKPGAVVTIKVEQPADVATGTLRTTKASTLETQTVEAETTVQSDGTWSAVLDVSGLPDGNLRVTASVTDLAGNEAVSDVEILLKDTERPTVTLQDPGGVDGPFQVTIDFSEPVTGFTAEGITATRANVARVEGSGRSYTAFFTDVQLGGFITVAVNEAAADDLMGNPSAASETLRIQSGTVQGALDLHRDTVEALFTQGLQGDLERSLDRLKRAVERMHEPAPQGFVTTYACLQREVDGEDCQPTPWWASADVETEGRFTTDKTRMEGRASTHLPTRHRPEPTRLDVTYTLTQTPHQADDASFEASLAMLTTPSDSFAVAYQLGVDARTGSVAREGFTGTDGSLGVTATAILHGHLAPGIDVQTFTMLRRQRYAIQVSNPLLTVRGPTVGFTSAVGGRLTLNGTYRQADVGLQVGLLAARAWSSDAQLVGEAYGRTHSGLTVAVTNPWQAELNVRPTLNTPAVPSNAGQAEWNRSVQPAIACRLGHQPFTAADRCTVDVQVELSRTETFEAGRTTTTLTFGAGPAGGNITFGTRAVLDSLEPNFDRSAP